MRMLPIIVAALGFGNVAFAGSVYEYDGKLLKVEDELAMRTALYECWLDLNATDQRIARTSGKRVIQFNDCIGRKGIPLIFLLK